jgi:hypothetical protein
MTSPSTTEQLDDLRRAVEHSRAAIADGSFVELAGLDVQVEQVVAAARTTVLAERPQVLSALATLLRELDGLTVDLCRQRDAGLALQAADAYRPEPGPTSREQADG